ncbi:MAG: NeuD/PglB/VioB family sugar acetyltransferase [Spirochaetota bacterium]
MQKLIIFPYNGNGREALDCISAEFECIGFADDAIEKQGKTDSGHEVFSRDIFDRYPEAKVLAVPGSPVTFRGRRAVLEGLSIAHDRFATIIHTRANVSSKAVIGRNVLIMAGVVLTSNARVGDHVCILPNSVVHHDSRVGDFTLVGSNVTVAGGTTIGMNCYIGSGTSMINGITVGDGTLIGMGAVVLRDVAPGTKMAGVPARSIGGPA